MTTPTTHAIGRERERAAIRRFLEERHPGAAALVLHGDPGIGKTTLWRDAVANARHLGSLVLSCRPAESEAALPFAGLSDLLDPVLDSTLPRLPAPQRSALDVALLRTVSDDSPLEQRTVAAATLTALRILGNDNALLIAIDDVQWLDAPTVAALTFAVRRLEDARMQVLIALRSAPGVAPDLPVGLEAWRSHPEVIKLAPMPATDIGTVLMHHLAIEIPRPRLETLAHLSGGNPLFALELARAGADRGPLPKTLRDALSVRLGDLDPAVRDAVTTAAAMLHPTEELMLDAGVERSAMASAIDAGVLTLDDGRIDFGHPLIASVAYEDLGSDDRRDLHLRLARSANDPLERGHHLSRSVRGPDEEVARRLDESADAAVRLGDHAIAAAFLERAISLDPAHERADERRIRAASELELAGDIGAATTLATTAVGRLGPGNLRARARLIFVSCSVGSDLSYENALAELALALDDATDDVLGAEIHLLMGEIASGMCLLDGSLAHLRAAIDLAERAGATGLRIAALSECGFTECMLGLGISENAERAFEGWDGSIVSGSGYSPRMAIACEMIHATRFDEAQELFLQEIVTAEEQGLESIEVMARAHLAEAQLRAGDWAEALTNGRTAVRHAQQAANAQIAAAASYGLAMTEALIGQHEVARTIATESLAVAEATRDFWFTISHRAVLGYLALTEDDAEAAVQILEPSWQLMLERGLRDLSIFPTAPLLGEALVAVGRLEDSEAISATLLDCAVGALPWCRAMAARCQALVASARGDHETARIASERALAAHRSFPEPFEEGRTLFILGRVERRAHGWARARTALEQALVIFDQLGATRWAEKASAEIARIPGRKASDGTLTATEFRVAELVAQGLSNKEVAARLFVSVRAVESNLTKVYSKLGLRSRSELAGRMQLP